MEKQSIGFLYGFDDIGLTSALLEGWFFGRAGGGEDNFLVCLVILTIIRRYN